MQTTRVNLMLLAIAMAAALVLVGTLAQASRFDNRQICGYISRRDRSACSQCCLSADYPGYRYSGSVVFGTGWCICTIK